MVSIPLTRGRCAIVDDDDAEWALRFRWILIGQYAGRFDGPHSNRRYIALHRELLQPPAGFDVDHINGDKLDNRRTNLRVATRSQNIANRGAPSNNTSGYKGVVPVGRRFQARFRGRHVGCFATPEDAARAYDAAAREYYGEFAAVNFP